MDNCPLRSSSCRGLSNIDQIPRSLLMRIDTQQLIYKVDQGSTEMMI